MIKDSGFEVCSGMVADSSGQKPEEGYFTVMPLVGGQEFGVSVNPIPTRGADYANHIIAYPPVYYLKT